MAYKDLRAFIAALEKAGELVTPDGLRIQIVDDFQRLMFALGSAQVQLEEPHASASGCKRRFVSSSFTSCKSDVRAASSSQRSP